MATKPPPNDKMPPEVKAKFDLMSAGIVKRLGDSTAKLNALAKEGGLGEGEIQKVNASCCCPAPPYHPFPREKIHTRGNIWDFTVG